MKNLDLSVIICCYNSQERIRPTLEHLLSQNPTNISWNLILVDNNCTDNTIEIAKQIWSTQNEIELIIIKEKKAGLSFAREAGIRASKSSIGVFCDDDNWFHENYLEIGYNYFQSNPKTGIIGGFGIAVADIEFPDWFEEYSRGYAVGTQGKEGDVTQKGFVLGAGIFVNLEKLRSFYTYGYKPMTVGRKGNNLSSGDDVELCFWFIYNGMQIHYNSSLIYSHYIASHRLTKEYQERMYAGFKDSFKVLRHYEHIIAFKNRQVKTSKLILIVKGMLGLIRFYDQKKFYNSVCNIQLALNHKIVFLEKLKDTHEMLRLSGIDE
jgi:glycosyltransferase involved in cell wall biosynthesis